MENDEKNEIVVENKEHNLLFDVFGVVAIVIVIVFIIVILNNRKEETIEQLEEKWIFKNDNNSNKIIDVGDEICLYTECFYIISNDGVELKALSKYNLEIGYNCIYKDENYVCEKIENETNLQNEKAIGYNVKTYNSEGNYGVIDFSNKIYWKDYDNYDEGNDDVNELEIDLNTSFNNIGQYLKIYKNKLESFGQEINDVTLITRKELIDLGCPNVLGSCNTKYNWIYSTSYWTRTSRSKGNIWKIQSSNYFSSNYYDYKNFNGIRPLIVIDLEKFNIESTK